MYVGLKQPRGYGERYVTPARAAAKETRFLLTITAKDNLCKITKFTLTSSVWNFQMCPKI